MEAFLVSSLALESGEEVALQASDAEPIRTTVRWAREYLCRPHAELGREGPVCPWTPTSMDKGLFYLTVYRGVRSPEQVKETIARFRDRFLALEPRAGNDCHFRTLCILFPELLREEAPVLIDGVQRELKGAFVARKLMLGEFHQWTAQSGMYNESFRPLRSPIPMLVIREMVPWDLIFLRHEREYVRSYLEVFGGAIPRRLWEDVRAAADHHGIPLPPQISWCEGIA